MRLVRVFFYLFLNILNISLDWLKTKVLQLLQLQFHPFNGIIWWYHRWFELLVLKVFYHRILYRLAYLEFNLINFVGSFKLCLISCLYPFIKSFCISHPHVFLTNFGIHLDFMINWYHTFQIVIHFIVGIAVFLLVHTISDILVFVRPYKFLIVDLCSVIS